jgi:hypothetical protein
VKWGYLFLFLTAANKERSGEMKNNKQSKQNHEILMREKSTYMDIFQKRPGRYRISETFVFIFAMILITLWIPSGTTLYKILAVFAAVIIIGAAPYIYQKWLKPEYLLTKTQLVIRMKGQERVFLLPDVERASKWKPIFRLQGKKESIMASNDFINRLEGRMAKLQQKKKKR